MAHCQGLYMYYQANQDSSKQDRYRSAPPSLRHQSSFLALHRFYSFSLALGEGKLLLLLKQ